MGPCAPRGQYGPPRGHEKNKKYNKKTKSIKIIKIDCFKAWEYDFLVLLWKSFRAMDSIWKKRHSGQFHDIFGVWKIFLFVVHFFSSSIFCSWANGPMGEVNQYKSTKWWALQARTMIFKISVKRDPEPSSQFWKLRILANFVKISLMINLCFC